jgi:hypothetical protein
VEANLKFTHQTATKYMRCFYNREKLNRPGTDYLSIEDAAQIIAKPSAEEIEELKSNRKGTFDLEEMNVEEESSSLASVLSATNTREMNSGEEEKPPASTETRPVRKDTPLAMYPRCEEISALYTSNTKIVLNRVLETSAGKEIWELILTAFDQGFIRPSRASEKHHFSARMLFTDSPVRSELSALDLSKSEHRKRLREVILPAAIANREAILAAPARIMEIIEAHDRKTREAVEKKEQERQIAEAVSKMLPGHEEIITFGEHLWPANGNFYDYDQVRAAVWYFREIEGFLVGSSGPDSVTSCAIKIRQSIKWLWEYAYYRSDQKKMHTVLDLVDKITRLWERNPEGKCKWPSYPVMQEGKW